MSCPIRPLANQLLESEFTRRGAASMSDQMQACDRHRGSDVSQPIARRPLWSEALSGPLATAIPARWHPATLTVIKVLHTAIFASVGVCILVFVWEGIRQRPGRRAAISLSVTLVESAIFASNNQVCPLTPLAVELGAERGSVADIFLPAWFSRRIPLIGGGALVLGLALNIGALLRRRR
jgi:hypothetical protein